MKAYWIVFAIMFLLQFIKVDTQKAYLWRLIISFIPLFVFAAFRVDFGYDYESYQDTFDIVHAFPGQYEDMRQEWGYLKLNEMLPSFRMLLVVTTAFTCSAYIFLFYRLIPANYTWLAVILLFLAGDKAIFFMFSGIRNAISISILIFTLPLLEKRRLLPFLLCMFIAAQFHKTAYVYFPMAYLVSSNKDFTLREFVAWGAVFAFFFVFSNTAIMTQVDVIVTTVFDDGRYDTYVETMQELGDVRGTLGKFAMVATFIPAVIYMRSSTFSSKYNVALRLGLMYIMATAMGALNARTTQHFIMFFIVLGVYIAGDKNANNIYRLYYLLFVVAYLAYAFFKIFCGAPTFPYEIYESSIFGVIK